MNKRTRSVLVDGRTTIKAAIAQLDATGERILLVKRREGTLVGTVTDGDVRRWILTSGDLSAPVENIMNRTPVTVPEGASAAVARRLMLQHRIDKVPVVDGSGRIVDLFAWDTLFAEQEPRALTRKPIDVPVVIMAGGRGTRLDPFTRILPKPLIPFEDRPMIEAIMDRFAARGAKRFFVTLNYKASMIRAYFEGSESRPYTIEYVDESEPTGTAGSLTLLPKDVKGDFFLTNCDIVVDADYGEILEQHLARESLITIVASMQHFRVPYGVIELDADGGLAKIHEKPEYDLLANTGLYVVNRKVAKHFPDRTSFDMTELVERVRAAGGRVGVYPTTQRAWIDVGQWSEYFRNALGEQGPRP